MVVDHVQLQKSKVKSCNVHLSTLDALLDYAIIGSAHLIKPTVAISLQGVD